MESALVDTGMVMAPTASQNSAALSLGTKSRDRRKTPAFLSNLGKATLRGIRRCPRCGVYNGTRGLSCKNKACGVVFRDGAAGAGGRAGLKKGAGEVVRLVINGDGGGGGTAVTQVFSLRQRGRGAEQRGFVELTVTDTTIATEDGTVLTRISLGRCFVPACLRGQGQGQGQALSPEQAAGTGQGLDPQQQQPESPCVHVKRAMECQTDATPLPLKSSVLDSMQAPVWAKEEVWQLATESASPLVQRVSRGTLVVKCHISEQHPLGLLHVTVGSVPGATKADLPLRERSLADFHCACQAVHPRIGFGVRENEEQESQLPPNKPPAPPVSSSFSAQEPCLHFYACVCAIASDDKLAAEFADFLGCSYNGGQGNADCSVLSAPNPLRPAEPGTPNRAKRVRINETLTGVRETHFPSNLRRPAQRKHPISAALKSTGGSQPVDEGHVSLSFQQWLASVTERIHQTMHFQFDAGKPEPLVFHIPQAFFNALQQRLSLGSKKRRLPNSTTAFVRSDALPLGTFSKYTWHITNLLHVKRIFDTPELPLELTQSFVKNRDGSYSPFRCPEVLPDPVADGHGRSERPQAIRPLELRTFLRVGTSTPEQKGPTPFVIEWIPDILPQSRVGELRIHFEYGHQHGTQPESAGSPGAGGAPRGRAGPDASQSQPAPTIEILRVVVP
ncbi:uncharacterized protein C2orf42 homolog isoform X1 [Brienomyrus brachyistius]|uniref:uncharacterized protein C2orf42 homolog isoform X1 n=1 Tax=Brienomyrus brachyistius TaxID=42636 RepID=UPI0020B3F763|nr:uncharacterized protein C2orf42 homolog isoform X1 [Brienomyrus brachyistius]XP_048874685.1 uncharacterized protein C2orf42 homolog isoform X1 [Brienomyrus brachyistius]